MSLWEIYGDTYKIRRPKKQVPVYIRYGLFAGMRKSSNHTTGEGERGLSVYPAELVDGVVRVPADVEICDSLSGQGRLCIPVTGRCVGTGSDGEPVIVGVQVLPYAVSLDLRR